MNEVFLGLGGNIGKRHETLNAAVRAIKENIGDVIAVSSVYETEAWGIESVNLYLNQVIKVITKLSAEQTMKEIGRIEKLFGRKRTEEKNADRTIDIDLLFFNQEIIMDENLQVPHPRIQLRRFVLIPLSEIAGSFIHPVFQVSVNDLLSACEDALGVKKYKEQ